MLKQIHPSWVIVILAIFIIAVDIGLALTGVVKSETVEAEVVFEGAAEWFGERVEGAISSEVSGLGMGYLLGTKDGLPDGLKDKIQVVGLSHIIVVSGTHLAIIVGWARKIFGRLSRNAGVYFAILLLCCYIGVVVLTPMLLEFFYGPREKPGLIGSTIIASAAAMVACLPISFYYFGSVSLLSFVANILILPTIPIAMGLTLLAGVFGGMFWNVFGVIAEMVLRYHIAVINFLGQYDSLLVEGPKNNAVVYIWYGVVGAVVVWWSWKRQKRRRERLKAVVLLTNSGRYGKIVGK